MAQIWHAYSRSKED